MLEEDWDMPINPIFSGNSDVNKNAYLNWRMRKCDPINNLLGLAEGFFISAEKLIDILLINNTDREADILIFPILTNANHAIESYLKALIWIFNQQLKSDETFKATHDLKYLYETAQSLAKRLNIELKNGGDYLLLANYVKDIFSKSVNSTDGKKTEFTRYPFDENQNGFFYVAPRDNAEIDLENLKRYFARIHGYLYNLTWHQQQILEEAD